MSFTKILSVLNSRNCRLLNSEIFGLTSFSAPLSNDLLILIQYYSLMTLFLNDALLLSCQIYVCIFLRNFFTPSSLAFISSFFNLLGSIFIRCQAKVTYNNLPNSKLELSQLDSGESQQVKSGQD